MNSINSLYQLIKQKSRTKGRPLKIICDWDDCLQMVKPRVIINEAKDTVNISLEEFFKEFWENANITSSSTGGNVIEDFQGSPEAKKAVEEFKRKREEARKNPEKHNFSGEANFYEKSPLLSTVEELLQSLKEELIEKLVVISSYIGSSDGGFINESVKTVVKEKSSKIENSFKKYPQVEVELTKVIKGSDRRLHPHRWEVIRNKYPDFDMYIDDNYSLIANSPSTLKYANQIPNIKDKIFVLNDYKSNRKVTGPNIYHVKTTISDITNRDFALGALEYRTNKLERGIRALKQQNRPSSPIPIWLIVFPVISLILALLIWIFAWKKTKKNQPF